MEFFLNGTELLLNSVNSGNLENPRSPNLGKFKVAVCFLCLVDCMVTSWSLT